MTIKNTPQRAIWITGLCTISLFLSQSLCAGGVLRTGHPGEPDSLDPHLAIAAPALIVNNDLFEGLFTLNAQGRPVLGAAESYQISPDGLTYTFRLRPDLRWSDGKPIQAKDFIYSMRRLADPATASTALAAWIDLIEGGRAILNGNQTVETLGVSALDTRTVKIKLVNPVPYFLSIISFPVFAPLPQKVIDAWGSAWTRPEHMVSNGPFMLEQWRPGHLVRVKRNPYFHAATQVRLDAVEYIPVNDLNTGLRLFQSGKLDVLTNFPPEKIDSLRKNMSKELRLTPSLGVTVYLFNHRLPKFSDPRVRRALALAIDLDVLTVKLLHAGDTPAWSFIPNGISGYGKPLNTSETMIQRVNQAKLLLKAAGYISPKRFELELLYHTSEEHKKVAVAIAAMWNAIGVNTTLRNADRQVVEVATRNGEFEVVRAAWFSPYSDPMGFLSFLRRGSPANSSGYDNAMFDSQVDAAAKEKDSKLRKTLLYNAEQIASKDQAVIPLYYLTSRRLVSQRVQGWRNDNLSALRPARWLSLRPEIP